MKIIYILPYFGIKYPFEGTSKCDVIQYVEVKVY